MEQTNLILIIIMAAAIAASGCTSATNAGTGANGPAERAKVRCIEECRLEKSRGTYLEDGPCLTDVNPRWDVNDWVCDVAHSPRQDVDSEQRNQCTEYREGLAGHFVEVDPDCNFIRAV